MRLADGPASALSWSLDATTFEDLVVELLRDEDQVPVQLLVESAVPIADQGVRSGDGGSAADYVSLIDKLTVIAGVGIRLGHDASRDLAISAFVAIYEHVVGLVSSGPVENLARPPAVCWLDIGLRITLLGGLTVRRQSWSSVRCLAQQRVPDARYDLSHYWLRHALTQASRAKLLGGGRFDERSARPWIGQAFELAGGLPSLTRDLPPGSSRLVDSLYQFDLMAAACVVAETNSTDPHNWYPNFASASRIQLEPAVMRLLTDSIARKAIFPLDDDDLAVLLRALAKAAGENAPMWSLWEGWRRKEITEFLDSHPPPSE